MAACEQVERLRTRYLNAEIEVVHQKRLNKEGAYVSAED